MKKKAKKVSKGKSAFTSTSKPKSCFSKREKTSHICDPSKCHTIDPSNYCFYQTSQTIKIYVTIPGVENLSKSNLKIRFQAKGFELSVYDLINSNYHLIFDNLSYHIVASKCKYFTRKDKVILELTKETHKIWKSLEEVVSKEDWIQSYCEYLEDIPEFVDPDALYGFAEGMWEQMLRLQDNDFNYLKPPPRMQELIPSLRKQSAFKSLEAATAFYKSQLKKDCFNEALYILLGGTLLEKMRVEHLARLSSNQAENIEESTFRSTRPRCGKESSTERDDTSSKKQPCEAETTAEEKKAEGNAYYRTGKFYAALQLYLEAIELWPENATFYSNASASYMMLGLFSEALNMAQKAVKADPSFSKGYLRIGKCNLALGSTKAAMKAFTKAKELDSSMAEEVDTEMSLVAKLQEYLRDGRSAANDKNYSLAASLYDSACAIASASSSLVLLRAEYLILCDKVLKAKGIARALLEQNVEDADARCILGMVAYYQDDKDEAFRELDEALRISRNHTRAKTLTEMARCLYDCKERGNEAFKQRKYIEALKHYYAGLKVDSKNRVLNAKLHYNVASVQLSLNETEVAIKELSIAISIKPDYVKAYIKRATLYQEVEDHFKAVQDVREVVRLAPTDTHKRLLHEAQERQNLDERKNYYEILGVHPIASGEEVKSAYKRLALRHHPDRHAGGKEKLTNERLFKDVSEAYNVLKDPTKRARYDASQGYAPPDDPVDDDDLDEKDLFKLFLFTQFLNRDPRLSDFFFEDDDTYSYDDDDDDDSEYDLDADYGDLHHTDEWEESST